MRSNSLEFSAIQRSRRLSSALLFVVRAFVIGVFWIPVSCRAETTPDVWLERLSHSMSELDYRGEMVYTRGEHQESLRVTHGLYNGEMYERLEHLDGERREIIRHLEEHNGNIAAVARSMGKARMQIQRWLKRLAVDPVAYRQH